MDDVVRAELSGKGLSLGYNEKRGEIVAVGKNMAKMEDVASCPRLAALRDRCHKIASLEARGKILQLMRQSLTAERSEDFQRDGNVASLNLFMLNKAFSERVLTGWRIVASAEEYSNGIYSVAVAVSWSNESEEKLEAAKAGQLVSSDKWKEELMAYIKRQDLSTWADVRVFVDSKGFPHVLGIGLSDWDGDPRTQNVAMRKADMFAQKNLMLGLYGDAAIMEAARKWRKEVFHRSGSDGLLLKFYESLSEVQIRRTPPAGCGPFHVAVIENPVNGRKEFVSIYSFEPDVNFEYGQERITSGISDNHKVSDAASASGVMLWNPNTGKFENREY